VLEIRQRQARERYVEPGHFVLAYSQLGDMDRALQWLDQAVEEGDAWFLFFLRDPVLDPLRADPRYAAILHRHGLRP
jgi:hypothetical protein